MKNRGKLIIQILLMLMLANYLKDLYNAGDGARIIGQSNPKDPYGLFRGSVVIGYSLIVVTCLISIVLLEIKKTDK
jgi:uncharacterized membrane-anchored protein